MASHRSLARLTPLISLLIPGSGQFLQGERLRGLGLFVAFWPLLGLVIWFGATALLAPLLALWLWQIWDAYQLSQGRRLRLGLPVLLAAFVLYGLGIVATEVRPQRLATGWPSMQPYLRALTQPELLRYPTEDLLGVTPIQVPCIDPLPPPARQPSTAPLVNTVACAAVGDVIEVTGEGFFPEFEGEFWWTNPIGDRQRVLFDGRQATFATDDQGRFRASIRVPLAVPLTQIPAEGETQTHLLRAEQYRPYGVPQPTETFLLVVEKIGETIALAFLATVLGVLFAVPISFLAARNLMYVNPVTRVIYLVVRTLLNIVRSIETLMWAIIFAVWVGLGPFGGMLALWFHTVAALAKLYSEAIESIDPGPIEAIRATGARGPQVAVFAVIPQILTTFISFTLYRWDINVRLSTVIGLVSDAGLGFLVIQWIRLNRFSSMATAIIAIMLVVTILDSVSGVLRKRVLEGAPVQKQVSPVRQWAPRLVVTAVFALALLWSWGVARVDFNKLVRGAPDGLRIARAFVVPDILERPVEERTVSRTLPVPCVEPAIGPAGDLDGPRVELSLDCGEVGDPLVITGYGLPPDTLVSVRWAFPDGAFLRVRTNCCLTDADGRLRLETNIHPLMELDADTLAAGGPGSVAITWTEVVGGLRFSATAQRVLELSIVTLLMALLATTLGSFFAIPLSFLAARNIMGQSLSGRIVFNTFRFIFNLSRSVEPMILVLICAAWVGAGPFAGVLALALNNIPNLGKLFSETIEDIDRGPVEALLATGANRLQTLLYAVAPQLVPPFLAFILYQLDINIRMSTVIGFVGGGGIGQQFRLWVGLNQYDKAGTAVWAIVLMVWTMDYISAKARERLV